MGKFYLSGSPIIRRCKENYVVGLHFGEVKKNKKECRFNLAISFDSILDNIKKQNNNKTKINLDISKNIYIQSNLYNNNNLYFESQNLYTIPYDPFYQNQNNSKNDNFTLYFRYNDKEGYIDLNEDDLLDNVINKICNKYPWLPRTGVGFYIQRGDKLVEIEKYQTIRENGLKHKETIIFI